MNIIAVAMPGGKTLARIQVAHGRDPRILLWHCGWVLRRYLSAHNYGGEVSLIAQVRPIRLGDKIPKPRERSIDYELLSKTQNPRVVQRIACYAITFSPVGLLATRFARSESCSGLWGLPGGGHELGEQPAQTVLREVMEETGQTIKLVKLLDLQSDHWAGQTACKAGEVEDFHALRIIYLAKCSQPTRPKVLDIGGTTAEAAWVPVSQWRKVNWSASSRDLLEHNIGLYRNIIWENR